VPKHSSQSLERNKGRRRKHLKRGLLRRGRGGPVSQQSAFGKSNRTRILGEKSRKKKGASERGEMTKGGMLRELVVGF